MAGMQTEILDEPGTDCGTTGTLDFVLTESDVNDFLYRNINDNGKVVLMTPEVSKKYIGKKIHLYSPMKCAGTHICAKCAGKMDNKFVGLDTNKIATTLTNLNMKKFHDSTLRFYNIDCSDILTNESGTLFKNDGTNIIVNTDYIELYIPTTYINDLGLAENLGTTFNLFGVIPVGIFKGGEFDHFDTLNLPAWHRYNVFDTDVRMIDIPGMGETNCIVLKYLKGHQLCNSMILEDSINAQLFLRQVIYGKVPSTIPYSKTLGVWRKNTTINKVNFGVPSIILEVVLSCCYRYKYDPSKKFATIIGSRPDEVSEYDYSMAGIRKICQVTSTFTGITFESFDEMVSTSINRARENKEETESPLEILFKL